MFMFKRLSVSTVLIMFQLSVSLCDTGYHPINQIEDKDMSSLCPSWTYRKDNNSECTCGNSINGIVLCNMKQSVWYPLTDSSALGVYLLTCHCMSYSEKFDTIIMGECPYLCTAHYYYHIPDTYNQLNTTCSTVIQQNRTGQLCSRCIEGYAPSAYSYGIQCADCTNYHYNWIKYLSIAYLPITVLYLAVIIFKLNATSPSMNGCIFVCQMISSPSYMSLSSGFFHTQTSFYSILSLNMVAFTYGIWNLDFFHLAFSPLCVHPSISTLQVISLDYVIALYPLLLMFITYVLIKVHDQSTVAQFLWKPITRLITWLNKESTASISLIKAFSTFFLLSYVKILNTSLNLLTPVQVVNVNGHVLDAYTYYDGSVEYFGPEHLPYATLATFICIIFNILPLILLCLYPCQCFQSCLNNCRFIKFNQRLYIFVDTFQGHYRLEPFDCRYFSVFFLVLRIFGFLTFYFIKSGFVLLVVGMLLIPITAFYAIVRPYKDDVYNIIDIVFLLVLILFCFAAASAAICSLETKCFLVDITLWVLSAAFFPLYAVVFSNYCLRLL